MKTKENIKPAVSDRKGSGFLVIFGFAAFMLLAGSISNAFGQAAADQPKTFSTAQAAADSLIAAATNYDETELKGIFGPGNSSLIFTGNEVADKQLAAEFVEKAKERTKVAVDPRSRNRAILSVGEDSWPFPIPIVKVGTKWRFDPEGGRQELLVRRIGRNELDAIEVCRGYVDAQREYASEKHDDSIVNQYAQRIISTPGKHDGLAWQNADGTWGGAVGERAAKAIEQSYTGKAAPFHGYYFKILKGQGPSARLGTMDYMVNGAMIGGFALVAYPSIYRLTGVKSFMVSYDGVVYEKDLGPDTVMLGQKMELYDPDRTWAAVY